jgi:DSF synthase
MENVMYTTGSVYGHYQSFDVRFDAELGVMWGYMDPHPRPCFSSELLSDILRFQEMTSQRVRQQIESNGKSDINYVVFASRLPGIYSMGGDLNTFVQLIRKKDRETMLRYASTAIDAAYGFHSNMGVPVTTISLVQGDALGGGLEAALSCNVIIAERGIKMGFPEVLFNLFPGMGAYSFLTRRMPVVEAERLLLNGRAYTAEEMYELGVVDVLAEPGRGGEAVAEYVRKHSRHANARRAVFESRRFVQPITHEELLSVVTVWVDAALRLEEKDLRTMERLVRAQNRLNPHAPRGNTRRQIA